MGIFDRIKGVFKGKKPATAAVRTEKQSKEKSESGDRHPSQSRGAKGDRPRRRGRGRHQARSRGTEGLERPAPAEKPAAGPAAPAAERSESASERGGQPRRRRRRGRRGHPAAQEPERPEQGPPRHGRGKKRGKTNLDLGGVAQRMDFPDLLPIDESSEEFRQNEFRPLGLSDKIVLALAANRFRTPTDIQNAFIPVALRGTDLLGQAKTGTGKTVAFLMPIFDRLDISSVLVQALIVVPTRELCRQVSWEARRFSRTLHFKVLSLYGGTSVNREIEQLREGAQIVVGTPGRLLDHLFNHNLDLTALITLVLDEADRMFDIGFRQDVIKIIKYCPPQRQIMLLSATLDDEVEEISRHYMKNAVPLYLSRDEVTVESIWQRYITVSRHEKMAKLAALLAEQKPTQSIIFTNTKRMSDSVALRLAKQGFKARCIHSDLSQNKRERIMDAFRTGQIEHLVATDVAARGLDITGISHVINYDIPDQAEDYVHRVGRTGRMGAAGKTFTFVTAGEGWQPTEGEKFINKQVKEFAKT